MTLRALTLALALLTSTASASGLSPYVQAQYDLGQGGEPAGLADVAAEPLTYLRSVTAWYDLRRHIGERLGHDLSSHELRRSLTSNRVRLHPCRGSILTAGMTADGERRWFMRECHQSEELIAVQVPRGWLTVASMGCWNPVWAAPPWEPSPHDAPSGPVWKVPTHPVAINHPSRPHTDKHPHAVSEASMWPLFGVALAALALIRRRKAIT